MKTEPEVEHTLFIMALKKLASKYDIAVEDDLFPDEQPALDVAKGAFPSNAGVVGEEGLEPPTNPL